MQKLVSQLACSIFKWWSGNYTLITFLLFSFSSCRDFSWSPGGNIIAFWVPEDKDIPARVTLMQLPSRQEIRVRNLFNVVDCKLHWQKNGDYLCVKVDRTPKGTQVCSLRHVHKLNSACLSEALLAFKVDEKKCVHHCIMSQSIYPHIASIVRCHRYCATCFLRTLRTVFIMGLQWESVCYF